MKENCHVLGNKKNVSQGFAHYIMLRAISYVKTGFQFSSAQLRARLTATSPCASDSEVFVKNHVNQTYCSVLFQLLKYDYVLNTERTTVLSPKINCTCAGKYVSSHSQSFTVQKCS